MVNDGKMKLNGQPYRITLDDERQLVIYNPINEIDIVITSGPPWAIGKQAILDTRVNMIAFKDDPEQVKHYADCFEYYVGNIE